MADGETHYLYYKKIFFPVVLPVLAGTAGLLFLKTGVSAPLFLGLGILNYLLARYVDPDNDQPGITNSEGRMMHFGRKLGKVFTVFGYMSVAYWFLYAWFVSLFGGHRSIVSHSLILGTFIRMVYFNIPIAVGLWGLYLYGAVNWGWTGQFLYQIYFDKWGLAYIGSQGLVWTMTDGMHLLLDTEWAKGRLYKPKKKPR